MVRLLDAYGVSVKGIESKERTNSKSDIIFEDRLRIWG